MEHTSGSADMSRALAGEVSDLPARSALRLTEDGHSSKPSPSRNWQNPAPAALGPSLDVRVGPDLASLQNSHRLRKPRTRDELHDAGLAHAEHVDQFGHGHDCQLTVHSPAAYPVSALY